MKNEIFYKTSFLIFWEEKVFYFKFIDWDIYIFNNELANIEDVKNKDYMIFFYIKDCILNEFQKWNYKEMKEEEYIYFFWNTKEQYFNCTVEEKINNIIWKKENEVIETIMKEPKKNIEINNFFIDVFKSFLPSLQNIEKTRWFKYYNNFDCKDIITSTKEICEIEYISNETEDECYRIFNFWKIKEFKSGDLSRKLVLLCESFIDYKFNDDTIELAFENLIKDYFKIE